MEENVWEQCLHDQMRHEWNDRARTDANYYIAFGRRDQDETEFLQSAADVIRDLEGELKRFPAGLPVSSRRALEIGCGKGRLIRPMSRYFGEIHGVDVSDEMIRQCQANLRDISNAQVHHTNGSDLALFQSNHFDFIYSYAVFQHIPSAEVVMNYLREVVRLLKPGGLARMQINGLLRGVEAHTTWEGVGIEGNQIRSFTQEQGVRLLALSGVGTQYMWTTWQKHPSPRIRSIFNSYSLESAIPASGSLACASIWIENLPSTADLNSLDAYFDDVRGTGTYLGREMNGILSQLDAFLPAAVRTGLVPVRVTFHGRQLCAESVVRIIPPGPVTPRMISVTDGVNLLSPRRVESGSMKVIVEDVLSPDDFSATVAAIPVGNVQAFQTDPRTKRYEFNFTIPPTLPSGEHTVEIRLGKRLLINKQVEVLHDRIAEPS